MIGKWLKTIFAGIGILLFLLIISGLIFINVSPEFGGSPTQKEKEAFQKTGHYQDGAFVNLQKTTMDMSLDSIIDLLGKTIKGTPNKRPNFDIPVLKVHPSDLQTPSETRLVWFGHSAFFLQIDGLNVLLDPMLGDSPAPHPMLGTARFSKTLPITVEELPTIDVVIISHDHYDHLDYGSILKLENKTKLFIVPLGVGAHFKSWGIDERKIVELDWWQEKKVQDVNFIFTPSRHFSGRGLTDRNATLWGSWVITGKENNLFFSGDGGYGSHFKEIGEKLGPFDLAMMECGQYNPKWGQIHMMPEESALAGREVKAKTIMPIHWGAFTLALHSWTDPVERIIIKAKALNLPIITPKIGEEIYLHPINGAYSTKWWLNY